MKTKLPLAFFILCLAGCANETPVQLALDLHNGYDLTVSGLTEARHAGLISDAQKAQIEKVRAPLYASIVALDKAAIADNNTDFKSMLNIAKDQLDALQKWLLAAKAQKANTALK